MGCCGSKKPAASKVHTLPTLLDEDEVSEVRLEHETEGSRDRTATLFLLSSQRQLLPTSHAPTDSPNTGNLPGVFGGGIYFVESVEDTTTMVEAVVALGISLICREERPDMTHSTLRKTYGCHSLKGVDCVPKPLYVVYDWAQVSITKITVKGKMYYAAECPAALNQICTSSVSPNDFKPNTQRCSDPNCTKCDYIHSDCCTYRCTDPRCIKSSFVHTGDCTYRCYCSSCIKENCSQAEACEYRCENSKCVKYGYVHSDDCRLQCTDSRCSSYGFPHTDKCTFRCEDLRCVKNGYAHSDECVYRRNKE